METISQEKMSGILTDKFSVALKKNFKVSVTNPICINPSEEDKKYLDIGVCFYNTKTSECTHTLYVPLINLLDLCKGKQYVEDTENLLV